MATTVNLTALWINLASDLSQAWSFDLVTSLQMQPVVNTAARRYAGGNYRMFTTPGRQAVMPVTIRALDADQRTLLEVTLPGVLLCVRDNTGRKFYGFYANPQITEHTYNDECDITLTFQQVTVSEAV